LAIANPRPPEGQDPRDTQLLERLALARAAGETGDEREIVGQLIAGWQPRVEAFAAFKGFDLHAIDEIVSRWSERMVRALGKRTSFDGPFGAVAMMNANWACLDHRDQSHLEHERPSADPLAAGERPRGGERDDVFGSHTALEAALASLSERQRSIVNRIYGDGKERADVAIELGITDGALRTALCRALAKVRRHLREAGVTNRGGPPV
jgi:RNA polymerase sigma factor (sigma-70 family)